MDLGIGLHLVSWNKTTRPKQEGGLSDRSVGHYNIALLGKLVWDHINSPNKLWVHVLSNKYFDGE